MRKFDMKNKHYFMLDVSRKLLENKEILFKNILIFKLFILKKK